MSSATLSTIEELGTLPSAPPARPRVLLLGTIFASGAAGLMMLSVLAIYLAERAATIKATGAWFDDSVVLPLTPGNMSLVGFGLSLVFMQWAVTAIGNDDRRHTWIALACMLVIGAYHFAGTGFLYNQAGLEVATPQGAVFYAATGTHLALTAAGLLFLGVMAFRTLGGQYSAKDREGIVAATVFWWVVSATYALVWYAIYVTK